MKISKKPERTIAFDRLAKGDIFKTVNDKLYMKMEDVMDPDGNVYNCVNIENGIVGMLAFEAPVTPVDYELVIK